MKNIKGATLGILALFAVVVFSQIGHAQNQNETYRGDIFSSDGPRVQSANFTLKINKLTSDEQANQNLSILQNEGQDKLLSAINKETVGTISFNNGLTQTINVVREKPVDGKTHVFAVFERWMDFAEIRGGYRSMDYPFGVIELLIDPATGKGEGTFIAAAQIRWVKDKKTDQDKVEIENFGTYPAKLVRERMSVKPV